MTHKNVLGRHISSRMLLLYISPSMHEESLKRMIDMLPVIKLQSIVLDCKQPSELAKFYMSLLGGEIVYEIEYFVSVSIPGESISISCQFDEDYIPPIWPETKEEQMKMVHLDFAVQDIDAAVDYAISLGAAKPTTQFWQPDWGPKWITLLDPAGHPICLCLHE